MRSCRCSSLSSAGTKKPSGQSPLLKRSRWRCNFRLSVIRKSAGLAIDGVRRCRKIFEQRRAQPAGQFGAFELIPVAKVFFTLASESQNRLMTRERRCREHQLKAIFRVFDARFGGRKLDDF